MNRTLLRDYILFNRNILIGFTVAFLTGAGASQTIAKITSPLVISLISIVVEIGIFFLIFEILFYILITKTNLLTNKKKEENLRK